MLKVEHSTSSKSKNRQSVDVTPIATASRALTSELVSAVGVAAIQELAEKYSPDRIFPAIRTCLETETDTVLNALRAGEPEQDLLDAIVAIAEGLDERFYETLRGYGVEIDLSGHQGTALTKVFLQRNDQFSKAYLRQLGSENLLGRNYHFFRTNHVLEGAIPMAITKEHIEAARAKCFKHFEKRGYGPTYSVTPYVNETKIGFIITHGTPRGGQTKIDQQEKRLVRFDRSERTDFIFFDHDTRSVWASALQGDVAFYVELIAEVLFGSIRFSLPLSFDGAFALSSDLPERLLRAAGTLLKCVRLQARVIQMPYRQYVEKARNRGCLSETHPVDAETRANGSVTFLRLVLEPLSEKRARSGVIVIKDNGLLLPENIDEKIVRAVLRELKILEPYGN